jgi:hypothetical protein|tara:strand:- start:60 stop:419 length:360 start_codon:yes stop_codon:yes gene_type:complete
MKIPKSITQELNQYIIESCMGENSFSSADEDLHHKLFNEDYYIIGYYKAEEWLKKHKVNPFEAIAFVQDYERENFGDDAVRFYTDAEKLVNMMVYIIGFDLVEDLKDKIKNYPLNHKNK